MVCIKSNLFPNSFLNALSRRRMFARVFNAWQLGQSAWTTCCSDLFLSRGMSHHWMHRNIDRPRISNLISRTIPFHNERVWWHTLLSFHGYNLPIPFVCCPFIGHCITYIVYYLSKYGVALCDYIHPFHLLIPVWSTSFILLYSI